MLLRRALRSLLTQTMTNWVCELHNDAPDDDAPAKILAELAPGDKRFSYHLHSHNWGAVAVFNHAYGGGPEPFASLLEDDNWWEAEFLEVAFAALAAHPSAALAWGNMKVWQELPDGTWKDTGEHVWRIKTETAPVVEFQLPEALQAFDALHSQGAMVFRSGKFRTRSVPPSTPVAIIESLRERAAIGSLLLLTTPLANFARTLATVRDADAGRWLQAKLLVAASFLQGVSLDLATLSKIWAERRAQCPRDTDIFFCLALVLRKPYLLRPARADDWLHFLLHMLRHPIRLTRGLRFRFDHPAVWTWLVMQTYTVDAESARATMTTKQI